MPISAIGDCTEEHWEDVSNILTEVIRDAGFEPNLVSNADEVGIIQKRIIQNLYDNPIAVCDVSGKNPNVMFELGMRLAFDKPTIIVKDDKTSYSFDTAPIEHLEYPRDLRFNKIVEFRRLLKDKIQATHKKASTDQHYTTFLKNFGKFTVAKLETEEVTRDTYLLQEIHDLKSMITQSLARSSAQPILRRPTLPRQECERLITTTIASILDALQKDGQEITLPEMEGQIFQRAIQSGTLPYCFRLDNKACKERISRALKH